MLLKKLSILLCSSLITCTVFAQNNTKDTAIIDKTMTSFLECDSQFFQQLAKNKTKFEQFAHLATADKVAYFPVENAQKDDKNSIMFKKPIVYKGLNIVGYQNIYIETPFSGQYFFWGFIINNSLDKIKNTLSQLNWSNYNSSSYIANAKIYDRQIEPTVWKDNIYSIDGVIPRQATIEKAIYLETLSDNQSHLICSIQGDIPNDILFSIRPDMKPVIEEINKKREEKIKAYKLKQEEKAKEKEKEKAKTKEQSENQQSSQPDIEVNDNKTTENNSKDGMQAK